MKIKTKGREMKDAVCEFISLVPRGANQIPFRIIKSDKSQENATMSLDITNFHRLLKREKANTQTPTIAGLVVHKGEHLDALKEQLVAQGFSVDNMVEKADTDLVTFLQGDDAVEANMEGASLMAINNGEVMVALKDFSPWTDKLSSFNDRVQAQGFYMSIDGAADVLEDVIFDAIYGSEDQKGLSANIGIICDEFKAYCLGLVKALPSAAFKTEKALKAASTHAKQGKKNTNADDEGKAMAQNGSQNVNDHQHGAGGAGATEVDQDSPAMKVEFDAEALAEVINGNYETVEAAMTAFKAVIKPAPVIQPMDGPAANAPGGADSDKPAVLPTAVNKEAFGGEAVKEELPTKVVDAKTVAPENSPMDEALKAQLTGISDLLVSLKADMDGLKTTQQEQAVKIDLVVEKGEGLEQAMKGAVIGSASTNLEHPEKVASSNTRKSENSIRDTAFGGHQVFGG